MRCLLQKRPTRIGLLRKRNLTMYRGYKVMPPHTTIFYTYLYRSFPQKSPIISGSFAKNVEQHEAAGRYTRWRRLIGSPKLQIIFHNRATEYRSLLRKMTYKDKGSYESSPPCTRSLGLNPFSLCTVWCSMGARRRSAVARLHIYIHMYIYIVTRATF